MVNPVCFSGQDVVLAWEVRGRTKSSYVLSGTRRSRLTLTTIRTGSLQGSALHGGGGGGGNRYGSAKAELGLVIIFDLPEVAVVILGSRRRR